MEHILRLCLFDCEPIQMHACVYPCADTLVAISIFCAGISSRTQRLSEVLPRRSSLRVQGKAPDGRQVLSGGAGRDAVL